MTTDMMMLLLIAFILYREWTYRRDINKLLDRIMAKSLTEYLASVKTPSKLSLRSMSDREEYEAGCKKAGITPEKEEA